MKHTLKNRPKTIAGDDVSMRIVKPYEEWLEGLEAELRERLAVLDMKHSRPIRLCNFIKELLGDTP